MRPRREPLPVRTVETGMRCLRFLPPLLLCAVTLAAAPSLRAATSTATEAGALAGGTCRRRPRQSQANAAR